MRAVRWEPWLRLWSSEWVAVHDPARDGPLDPRVAATTWLGFPPASPSDVEAAETRLGRRLPPSLREFLLVTDGWRDAGNFIYRLAGTDELAWLRDTEDATWIDAFADEEADDPNESEALRRSLRLSLDGDAAIMFLDPDDVNPDGEWAGYWLSSWSGKGPERFDSFAALMRHVYASFHALRKPPGTTREHWAAETERARLLALSGAAGDALDVLDQAAEFGVFRADLLRFQLHATQGGWHGPMPLSTLVMRDGFADIVATPLFAELLPVLFAQDRLTGRRERFALDLLVDRGPGLARALILAYDERRREPDFHPTFGAPEFDARVREIVASLLGNPILAEPREHDAYPSPSPNAARRGGSLAAAERTRLLDEAWPRLREAMSAWRPVDANHVAPVSLFAEPLLAEMITPERGRELLATRRDRA